jgi:hypothetical protein
LLEGLLIASNSLSGRSPSSESDSDPSSSELLMTLWLENCTGACWWTSEVGSGVTADDGDFGGEVVTGFADWLEG